MMMMMMMMISPAPALYDDDGMAPIWRGMVGP
jgi:hypothetical protein